MKTFELLEDAIEFGNTISKQLLKPISVYKDKKTNLFVIFITSENKNKYFIGHWSYSFEYLCNCYALTYHIGYRLFKDKSKTVKSFPTKEEFESELKQLNKMGYTTYILHDEKNIKKFLGFSK